MSKCKIVIYFLAFLLLLTGISGLLIKGFSEKEEPAGEAIPEKSGLTVVLDPGHGGEDGGAVSASGLYEKDLNLQIALRVRDLLAENGATVILTRETDTMLYDKAGDYRGRKKAQDLAARRQIAEKTPDCVFVSIHMNSFPQAKYSGFQVWYSPNDPRSRTLAEALQAGVATVLQPENHRQVKAATSSIYLLHRLQMPAVLAECGFLSNPEEAKKLAEPDYQQRLAVLITNSLLAWEKKNQE